jgi:hypothetical protein
MTPGCFIVLLVGHLAARHENKWMMVSFFLGCLAALVYFTYKVSRRSDPASRISLLIPCMVAVPDMVPAHSAGVCGRVQVSHNLWWV